ncbi:MAG: type I restriction endonuclease [Gemmatimonadales bacterium]|nr:type I restriction endonuclease [Gemmatimonadales bacterium]
MALHNEVRFEDDICAELAAGGWLYARDDAAQYDRARALFPADLLAWVQASQPQAWEALQKHHGARAAETLLDRVRTQLDQRGTLDVLRHGVELLGVRGTVALAQFRPAIGLNPEIVQRYAANRLRVIRQVKYSLHTEQSLDLVLFLNGIPVATAELKTDFTQSISDAVDQYRFDRDPRPKGRAPEPLLNFPSGALVHFAVSHREVRIATKLEGPDTRFLPFNLGDHGGAGNPVPDGGGYRTAYLWRDVWAPESWLELLGRYCIARRDDRKQVAQLVFPRYHQLDVTRKLQAAIHQDGPGGRYLVQHSAGSGKTNSIAWTAHFLSELHDAENRKLFDSVLVISDRNVIDAQLQDALFDFQRTTGVVATIRGTDGSKSGELAEALKAGKKIIVCTIQTFPFALSAVRELAATEGKRFAVIADEAHSSQAGEAAASLKAVLSAEELAALGDGGEVSVEDLLAAQMTARAADAEITFIAFTATPKARTLELFGTRPDPAAPAGPDNLPRPFHVYGMRQAIEEGFILDVLRNYTPYSLAFRLAQQGEGASDIEVERARAMRGIMGWVRLHPYNIAQKVQVVVEHFRQYVAPLLGGTAKAMVVVASRVEAVRWKLAMDAFIREKGYGIGTLAAFSGDVRDEESGPEPFSERSPALNPGLRGRDIREAFATDAYSILLVANKFQTGFDQPLLCAMYIDRRLAGIQAVQTLSRLNRAHPGKDTTYVVDFADNTEEVLAAFRTYYDTAELAAVTDPNKVYDLKAKLDAAGLYDEPDIERVVRVVLDPAARQEQLARAVEPVADRVLKRYAAERRDVVDAEARQDAAAAEHARQRMEALVLFKGDMEAYLRLYTFLSQIYDYGHTAVEKRALFFRPLVRLLDFGREREGVDLSKVELTHYHLRSRGPQPMGVRERPSIPLPPLTEAGGGQVQEREKARLAEIIARVNDLFAGDVTEQDRLKFVYHVRDKLLESAALQAQASGNSKAQFSASPDLTSAITEAVIGALDAYSAMSTQALNDERTRQGLKSVLLDLAGLYEGLRERGVEGKPPAGGS